MRRLVAWAHMALAIAGLSLVVSTAQAQMPMPTTATPTLRGAQTMDGIAVSAETGFPALRLGAYFGNGGFFDFGVELSAPTYGSPNINGYFQNVGMDVRAPLRIRLLETSKIVGSLRVAPLFHVGRPVPACGNRFNNCNTATGLGATVGFMMDIPLPKIFKLIVGPDTRWGFAHVGNSTRFAGSFFVKAGIETLWKQFFFTLMMNVGVAYGPNYLSHNVEPLFRQFVGAGYKFR